MKTFVKPFGLLCLTVLMLGAGAAHAQLLPVLAGAVSTNAGAKLKFLNSDEYASTSGFVQSMTYQRVVNRYFTNNYYASSNFIFQAVSAETNSDVSAAIGSYIVCRIMSVTGPVGGVLTFWEQGAKWPTYEFPVNGAFVEGKNQFILSNCENGAGRPDGDPFGNIPGRRFTVNKPGEYSVTFKLYDISKNHPLLDAPIHAPSDALTVKFKTGIDMDITSFATTDNVSTLTFKQGWLTNMVVEASTNLTSGDWVAVAGPFTDTPLVTTNVFTNEPGMSAVFYRLRGVEP